MLAKDVAATALKSTQNMLGMYISDLSDADLLVRPVPGANHTAWQLGHLIASESMLKKQYPHFVYPELPAGFVEQHKPTTASMEPAKGFASKEEYLKLFNAARNATLANLASCSDADLDKPTEGNMAGFAPNLAAMFLLISNHVLMHAGQVTVVRRLLGKPVLF